MPARQTARTGRLPHFQDHAHGDVGFELVLDLQSAVAVSMILVSYGRRLSPRSSASSTSGSPVAASAESGDTAAGGEASAAPPRRRPRSTSRSSPPATTSS